VFCCFIILIFDFDFQFLERFCTLVSGSAFTRRQIS